MRVVAIEYIETNTKPGLMNGFVSSQQLFVCH